MEKLVFEDEGDFKWNWFILALFAMWAFWAVCSRDPLDTGLT